MTPLHLIVIGKLKESYWQEAEGEYLKRLSPWAEVILHEIKEESFSEKDLPEMIKAREADKIIETLEKIIFVKEGVCPGGRSPPPPEKKNP